MNYAEWKKANAPPPPKGHIPNDPISVAFLTWEIWRNGGEMSGCQG